MKKKESPRDAKAAPEKAPEKTPGKRPEKMADIKPSAKPAMRSGSVSLIKSGPSLNAVMSAGFYQGIYSN